ncbi:hypothetical protein FRC12_013725 [Ceratobasidium sp. 428]|nr:hypothetical protein FRC12_013725 [Ceratobasidium sp. 428]
MPKFVEEFKCPYCPRICHSSGGLERHITWRPACLAQRLLGLNADGAAELNAHHALPRQPSVQIYRGSEQVLVTPEQLRSDEPDNAMDWEPTADDDAKMETETAPYETPSSPRRSPSVTLEEIEDEDAPGLRNRGPHPFARRTRPSLFPEPHPNPTAGVAQKVYPFDARVPVLYETRLAEPDVFKEAEWLDNLPISQAQEAEYFRLPRTQNWYWNTPAELKREINRLPHGPPWYRETVVVEGDLGDEILDLWKRDVSEVVRWLLANRRFLPDMRFAPELHWDSPEKINRIYDEMWSGDWWWRMQNLIGDFATIAPIILSTDKTKMTLISGNQKAWPVYMSIGNISKNIRKLPSERATLLVGFIPVPELSNISNPIQKSEAGWQLFHSCMESILEPLKVLSRVGMDVLCADGGLRRVFPILAAYLADYPEQVLVTCVRDSRCPTCWIPFKKRGQLSARYPKRDRRRTIKALKLLWHHGNKQAVTTLGIRPTRPFWIDLPYANISGCMTPDLLHQMDKGVVGEHLVNWCMELVGEIEMDRRVKGMPRFQRLRHFARGISVISLWTGKEAKALACTLLSVVAGCKKPEAVVAARSILDFTYRAHMPELSAADLRKMDRDLQTFDKVKGVFIHPDNPKLLSHEDRFNDIPKIHAPTHYTEYIRELGTPDGFSTEITERLHIDCVKEPWRATNHVDPYQQMLTYLQQKEAWSLLRAYLHDTGRLLDPRFTDKTADDPPDEEEEEEVAGDGNSRGDGEEMWYPSPTIMMAKRPALGRKSGAYLISKHYATDLIPATFDYLSRLVPPGTTIPLDEECLFRLWRRCKLQHTRLPFYPTLPPQTDQVRAFPTTRDEEGREFRAGFFDVVLFRPLDRNDPSVGGLHRFVAGRVRAIFELPSHLSKFCSEKLVYLEHFQPFQDHANLHTQLYTTGHAVHNHRRYSSVVPLSRVRMTCHLAPRYHLFDDQYRISRSTDLLSIHDAFYLNKYASYWLFIVFEYWQQQHRLRNIRKSHSYCPDEYIAQTAPGLA